MADPTTAKKPVSLPSRMTVKSFADLLNMPVTSVMTQLIKSGVMAAMNEEIDYDTAAIVADDLGFLPTEDAGPAETADRGSLAELVKESDATKLIDRAPVVVVMGHVDHGKTKLLDAIRTTNVVAGEAGGITQHIGAYQVVERGRPITFIDTPGHEAFTAMRSRGARVADVAILVVAADDGVKPQTEEAIRIIQEAKLPFVVAINKVDKPDANVQKVKQELAAKNVMVEDWGGKIVSAEVSAKNKTGITELLDSVLLVAEVEKENLKANPDRSAVGTIIESHVDAGEGPVATVLVHTGTLKVGDTVTTGAVWGRVKALRDYTGATIPAAGPSVPARILGLKGAPVVGDILKVETDARVLRDLKSKKVVKRASSAATIKPTSGTGDEAGSETQKLNLVIRADTLGSLEAIKGSLAKMSHPEVAAEIIQSGLGNITEADVLRAETSSALLLGFNVVATPSAESVARGKHLTITTYDVIYDLIDDVKAALEKMLKPEVIETELGRVKILGIFRTEPHYQIIGGKVTAGKISANALLRVMRNDQMVGEGKLSNLQVLKSPVNEVVQHQECGMKYEGDPVIQLNDTIYAFSREVRQRHIGG
ncbi:MAG: translation initiation factor IF-2 [Candidatus Kerfeldbacteria bacterium]|nr:translation initiation factor IF-2 [Candidatus Kerfeldbacteria bacterium]